MAMNNSEILAKVANYLNEIAIKYKLISASTASAYLYAVHDVQNVEAKLAIFYELVLKIKSEHASIANTSFYQSIEDFFNSKQYEVEALLKAISKEIELETIAFQVPTQKRFVQIGRSAKPEHGNHIVFAEDKTLSRIHLVITVDEGEFFVEDRSANGTFVNGKKIEKGVKTPVSMEDEIRIGRAETLVELGDSKVLALLS